MRRAPHQQLWSHAKRDVIASTSRAESRADRERCSTVVTLDGVSASTPRPPDDGSTVKKLDRQLQNHFSLSARLRRGSSAAKRRQFSMGIHFIENGGERHRPQKKARNRAGQDQDNYCIAALKQPRSAVRRSHSPLFHSAASAGIYPVLPLRSLSCSQSPVIPVTLT
jgi:hypothetical protein